jgi:hypothetical protein
LRRRRSAPYDRFGAIEPTDFELRQSPLAEALDLVAVCRRLG